MWNIVARAGERDGLDLIASGGRFILGGVVIGSLMMYLTAEMRSDARVLAILAGWVITGGLVVGVQLLLIGAIKFAREVWRS